MGRSRDLGKKIVCVLLISRPNKSATMSQNIQVVTEHFVNVTVTSNTTSFGCQKRFSKDLTIGALKVRLLVHNFVSSSSSVLFFRVRAQFTWETITDV